MRARLLSLLIATALHAPLVAAQDAPAQATVQDAAAQDVPAQAAAQDATEQHAAQAAALASDDPDAVEAGAAKVPLDEIRRYVTVFNAIRQAYVDPVNDRELMASAVRGLLFDLDPHSAYLEKADAEQFDEQTRGSYDGVGVELQQLPDGTLRVIAPLDDSPAARAGLRSGDRIVAIDGKMLKTGQSDACASGSLLPRQMPSG